MLVCVSNGQREAPVNAARMSRLARQAIRHLRITTPGTLAITFIGAQRMRTLNKRFMHHDRVTDVLSFRYHGESTVGEILIAPSQARSYAKRHGIPYAEELSRYVVHGLLHWLGHEDRTRAQQRKMRTREDRLLAQCIWKVPSPASQVTRSRGPLRPGADGAGSVRRGEDRWGGAAAGPAKPGDVE